MSPSELEHGLFFTLGHYIALVETFPKGHVAKFEESGLTELDLRIWLAEKRDGMSHAEIGRREYPRRWKGKSRKQNQGLLSLVRRAIDRVERFLNRDGDEFVYPKCHKEKVSGMPIFSPSYELADHLIRQTDLAPAKGQSTKPVRRSRKKTT